MERDAEKVRMRKERERDRRERKRVREYVELRLTKYRVDWFFDKCYDLKNIFVTKIGKNDILTKSTAF
jgi:hypothetical protein